MDSHDGKGSIAAVALVVLAMAVCCILHLLGT
jgi:hypothetical protein